jgi:hypothetical protein
MIVVEAPPELPLEDIAVIEMVIVEGDMTEPEASSSEGGEPEATESDMTEPDPTAEPPDESDAEMAAAPVAASLEHEDDESDHEDGHGGSGHEDGHGGSGHEGGSGGGGNPYLMTFEVVWLDPEGQPLGVLPPTNGVRCSRCPPTAGPGAACRRRPRAPTATEATCSSACSSTLVTVRVPMGW